MPSNTPSSDSPPLKQANSHSNVMKWLLRIGLWGGGVALAGALSVMIMGAIALAVAFPNLPDISDLSDYRPKLPLRIFSSEGILIGEFGEERRHLTPIKEIPKAMIM